MASNRLPIISADGPAICERIFMIPVRPGERKAAILIEIISSNGCS